MTIEQAEQPDATAPRISIVAGNPAPEELAAVTAVISAMLDEIEDNALSARAHRASAWQRSQRALRTPIVNGFGAWRSFSG